MIFARVRVLLSSVGLLSACVDTGEVKLPDQYALSLLAVVQEDRLKQVGDAFTGSSDNMVSALHVHRDEHLVLIGLTAQRLEGLRFPPLLGPDHLPNVELSKVAEDCDEGSRRSLPLTQAEVLTWKEESSSFTPADGAVLATTNLFSLLLPTDWDPCRGDRVWRRFGGGPVLPNPSTILNESRTYEDDDDMNRYFEFKAGARLDEDRVVAGSGRVLYLFTRSVPYSDAEHERIDLHAIWDGWGLVSVAVHGDTVLFGLGRMGSSTSILGRVEVHEGRFGAVATATVVDSSISRVTFEPSGRVIAVGEAGLVLTATSAYGSWQQSRLDHDRFGLVSLTDDPAHPHLLGTDRQLYAGDAFANFEGVKVFRPEYDTTEIEINAANGFLVEEKLEIWGAFSRFLLHYVERNLEVPSIDLPPTGEQCNSGNRACGRVSVLEDFKDQGLTHQGSDATIYLVNKHCPALFVYHSAEDCMTLLPDEDAELSERDKGYDDLDQTERYITAFGDGLILELEL